MTAKQNPNLQTFASPLALAIYILDRISGEHRPLIPGLFERALSATSAGSPPCENCTKNNERNEG